MATYTLRIYDATGCVLAEGPLIADPTIGMDATHRYRVQIATTGTAKRCSVTAPGFEVSGDFEALGFDTRALCSGDYLVGTFDLTTAAGYRDALGNDPAQWFARGRRATPPLFGGGESAFCVFVANLKAYDARERREKAERRQREAALVALVAAVPDGLDPVGWRAAVLAMTEAEATVSDITSMAPARAFSEALRRGDTLGESTWTGIGLAAYRRALTPYKAPAPEKRRGGKAVRLTVDDGRDDD